MKNTNLLKRVSIACCSAILLSGSSVAFSAPKAEHMPTLHFSPESAEVWWEPAKYSKHSFIHVSMAGPKGHVSAEFPYGEEPYFSDLADGLYTYELYKAPPGTAMSLDKKAAAWAKDRGPVDHNGRSEQQRAERAPGQENNQRGSIQSGSFRVKNGNLVDPTLPEV